PEAQIKNTKGPTITNTSRVLKRPIEILIRIADGFQVPAQVRLFVELAWGEVRPLHGLFHRIDLGELLAGVSELAYEILGHLPVKGLDVPVELILDRRCDLALRVAQGVLLGIV